ncbi:MAG: hypothetical protein ACLTTH_16385 [Holdemanella porci]
MYLEIMILSYSQMKNLYVFVDIDIILENVVLTENNKFYILDYEWVFDCTVPISFILYRAILHSMAISELPDEQIDELYKRYGISLN